MVLRCKGVIHDINNAALIRINRKDTTDQLQNTIVLKIKLHCTGCSEKVKKFILKIRGVEEVSLDLSKDLVTVTGKALDVQSLTSALRRKLKRSVEVVVPATETDDGAKQKKDREFKSEVVPGDDGGGSEGISQRKVKDQYSAAKSEGEKEKKDKVAATAGAGDVGGKEEEGVNSNKLQVVSKLEFCDGYGPRGNYQVESSQDYMQFMMRGPQIFSDENPNAYCSIM